MSNTGVVVVTHGDAAVSMVQAVERVVGKLDVKTVTVQVGEPRVAFDDAMYTTMQWYKQHYGQPQAAQV